jgi:hypothetical protein
MTVMRKMNDRWRRQLPLPLVLLFTALGGCNGGLTPHGPVDPALAAFVSPDAVALLGVNMDKLRTTPLYRKLADAGRLPHFDQFRADSGFDPSRDIRGLLLSSDGKSALAAAQGAFPAKPPGSPRESEYRSYTLYANDPWESIAFIGRNISLGGPTASVRAAIDQYKSGGHGAPHDLIGRAQALPADVQIWGVVAGWRGATRDQLRAMGNLGNLDRVLRSVEGASLTVDLRAGVHAAFKGDCRTEADARSLADSLRALAALARMGIAQNQPGLARAFDGLQVSEEGRLVQMHIDIAEELAERLVTVGGT